MRDGLAYDTTRNKLNREIILTMATVIMSILAIFALVMATYYSSIRFNGSIRGVGVGIYEDANCTQPLQSVNVGIVDLGETKNWTIFVRNEAQTIIGLSMQTLNWDPATAESQIQLTWDYNGQRLQINSTLQVTLTLLTSPSLQGLTVFSFDAVISAT